MFLTSELFEVTRQRRFCLHDYQVNVDHSPVSAAIWTGKVTAATANFALSVIICIVREKRGPVEHETQENGPLTL